MLRDHEHDSSLQKEAAVKAFVVSFRQTTSLPRRLVGSMPMRIAVTAALGSEKSTGMSARQTKEKIASNQEITEVIMVERSIKQATVNDAEAKMFSWLAESNG